MHTLSVLFRYSRSHELGGSFGASDSTFLDKFTIFLKIRVFQGCEAFVALNSAGLFSSLAFCLSTDACGSGTISGDSKTMQVFSALPKVCLSTFCDNMVWQIFSSLLLFCSFFCVAALPTSFQLFEIFFHAVNTVVK